VEIALAFKTPTLTCRIKSGRDQKKRHCELCTCWRAVKSTSVLGKITSRLAKQGSALMDASGSLLCVGLVGSAVARFDCLCAIFLPHQGSGQSIDAVRTQYFGSRIASDCRPLTSFKDIPSSGGVKLAAKDAGYRRCSAKRIK
jgi:hypothetical protein